MHRQVVLSVALLLFTMVTSVYAESRALIISIGLAYRHHRLTGILGPARDTELATVLAHKMGFSDSQIKVLREEHATKAAILAGLQWVQQGVQEGEQAFIYYSGHGTQISDTNSDEDDGCDEALMPIDAASGAFLLDDELTWYLQDLQQRAKVVVFIDSCFSGTITRKLYVPQPDITKYFAPNGQRCGQAINYRSLMVVEAPQSGVASRSALDQLVVMTATAQNELAFGDLTRSGKGSLFTQALYDAIMESPRSLSFQALRDEAAKRIRQVSRRANLIAHTPQLEGNPLLLQQDLRFSGALPIVPSTSGGSAGTMGATAFFDWAIRHSKFQVAIQANHTWLSVGQRISFSFRSSKEGYLNLLEIEPHGNINVLFPNSLVAQNHIGPYEEKRIPEDIGDFRFEAQEPIGVSRVVALVTRKPLNMYKQSVGKIVGEFKVLTASDYDAWRGELDRSITINPETGSVEVEAEFGATDVLLEVVK